MHLSAPRCASFCNCLRKAYAVLFAVKATIAKPNTRKISTPDDWIAGRSSSRVQSEGDYEAARRPRELREDGRHRARGTGWRTWGEREVTEMATAEAPGGRKRAKRPAAKQNLRKRRTE
jgi:hypothetical protein